MKCILHIGTEKTGTTLLQNWLYDNKEKLSQVGIYLSDSIGTNNNRLIPAYFGETLDDLLTDNGIANNKEKKKYFSGFLDNLNGEISNAKIKHHTFIITSEHLHSRLTRVEEIQNLYDFLSNAFDEKVSSVDIELSPLKNSRHWELMVSDDSPDGFQDLSHAYTLFAESY